MKKLSVPLVIVSLFLVSALFILSLRVKGQDNPKMSSTLPEDVNQIFTTSCVPCHSSTGGFLSKAKLNFTEWTQYSSQKQHEKAEKIYSEVKKGAMPPKSVRKTRPEIIPTKEQIATIKKWSESVNTNNK